VEPRYRHEIVLDGGRVFAFGGGTRDHDCAFDVLDVFDLANKSWTRRRTFDQRGGYPMARKCHSLAQVGRRVYVIGGQNGTQALEPTVRRAHTVTYSNPRARSSTTYGRYRSTRSTGVSSQSPSRRRSSFTRRAPHP